MYYKQENGDTKGNEAWDQWLFCTLMRENLLLFTASSSHRGLSTVGTKSRNSLLVWPGDGTEEVLLRA
mgnify:CR=1 FL=1